MQSHKAFYIVPAHQSSIKDQDLLYGSLAKQPAEADLLHYGSETVSMYLLCCEKIELPFMGDKTGFLLVHSHILKHQHIKAY